MRNIDLIFVHCSYSIWGDKESITRWHVDPKPKGNGWSDIGYHYVIGNGHPKYRTEYNRDLDGLIEEGRPLERAGAHVRGHNTNSIGICVVGKDKFTERQYTSLVQLIIGLLVQFKLNPNSVKGHYEYEPNKTCPNIPMDKFRELLWMEYNKLSPELRVK